MIGVFSGWNIFFDPTLIGITGDGKETDVRFCLVFFKHAPTKNTVIESDN